MRSLFEAGDRLHAHVRRYRTLAWFTVGVRVLLALAFLPSGLVKVFGLPFTRLDPVTNPVGRFFHALENDMGGLYEFIGWCQLLAAVLLLIPRTALLGALVYLPIVAGIVVITTTIGFAGTNVIAVLMLLGAVYLCCWDWDRLAPLVRPA